MNCPRRRGGDVLISIERLEMRRLLAGPPAALLASLPATSDNENINAHIDETAQLGDKLLFTSTRQSASEHLWVTSASSTPTALLTTTGVSEGISALTPFANKIYFFAHSPAGDALYSSDVS